jgi:hypothetical protein
LTRPSKSLGDHARLQRHAVLSSGIKNSVIENEWPSDRIGCVRRLTLAEGYVREVLLCLDDRNYVFTYEIIEGTLPVRGYVAGVRLHRITDGNRTFAEWWADFEVVGADRDAMIAQIGNNVFAAGFRAVAEKITAATVRLCCMDLKILFWQIPISETK